MHLAKIPSNDNSYLKMPLDKIIYEAKDLIKLEFHDNHLHENVISILFFFLFQEDFVKWKGSLFYHFITTLVDEDVEIRKFGKKVWCVSFWYFRTIIVKILAI